MRQVAAGVSAARTLPRWTKAWCALCLPAPQRLLATRPTDLSHLPLLRDNSS